jgi:2-C-methyl-D-erythritol 4-phosphate cytidylyltransferase
MKGLREKVVAVVPAAGMGKRFGPGTNKPFKSLMGKPLIVWSLETLESVVEVSEIIPVLKLEDMSYGKKLFEEYGLSKIKRLAPGGKERQDSVYNGLKLIDNRNCIVLIHDGVRPFIEKDLIEKAIKALLTPPAPEAEAKGGEEKFKGFDGVAVGVPLKDTIKEAENGIIKKTLRRDSLWAIQTPQVFSYKNILAAYKRAMKERFYSTDDAALVEKYGGKIKIVMGSYKNIKITTPEDLAIAEFLLSRREKSL